MKYVDTAVVFREFPDEITLCINISGCPNACIGCHSSYLSQDIGKPLDTQSLSKLIERNYGITCVGFMGGDQDHKGIYELAKYVKDKYELNVGWYSGKNMADIKIDLSPFDFIKTGPYIAKRGPLDNPNTNQVYYVVGHKTGKMDANPYMWYDRTNLFWDDKDL